ncbi:MAG: MarC family protein [Holosporales bacterium]|jgi:multiple antibiotic resistance protein|nr:MarC family protein [Holosporales bacterium]
MFENVCGYFVRLFFVIGPHITVPFFLSCTQNYTNSERKSIGAKMCLYGLVIGIVFCLAGNSVLDGLGVSGAAFKTGGGLLLAVAGWGMIYSKPKAPSESTSPEIAMRSDIALCPLAFPMLIGPATLTTIIGMVKDAKPLGIVEQSLIVATMAAIIGIVYICVLGGGTLMRLLGKSGPVILEKVGGILLMGMALEMMFCGVKMYMFAKP